MLDEMSSDASQAPSLDKLDQCRKKIAEWRDLEYEKAQLEARVKEVNIKIEDLKWHGVVDIFNEAGIDALGVPPAGNMPKFEVELDDYVHANIPRENERPAFAYLVKRGMEDIIKTTFTVSFGLGEGHDCMDFKKKLDQMKVGRGRERTAVPYDVKQSVPWNTLTSWIKGEIKARRPLTAKVMGMLGATTGRVAKIKTEKKQKEK